MNSTDALAFAGYVSDVTHTIFYVFNKRYRPDALIEWLRPMTLDDKSRALLMHEDPLYIAADFLGIDRLSPSFEQHEKKYQEFRAEHLYPGRTPVATV